MENTAPTVVERLEDFVDHLLSIQAVPALWSSLEVPFILETTLDAILRVFCLEFAHFELNSIAINGAPIKMTRLATRGYQASLVLAFRQLLNCLPVTDGPISQVVVPNPVGEGDVTIVSCRVGLWCDRGVLVAGARRADFPTRIEILLLRLATNHVTMGLQEAHRVHEQCRSEEDIERKRAVEALKNSEDRVRLLLDGIKDYTIVMLDPNGRVMTWNKGGERLREYRPEEIIGQYFSCFYEPGDIQLNKPEQALKLAAATGRFEDDGWHIQKDGSRFWANVVITALRGEQGELQGFVRVTQDLSELHKARMALEEAYQEVKELKDTLANEKRYLKSEIRTERGFEEIVGQSQALRVVLRKIEKVASTDATVLIQGETGTGKEMIARALHTLSKRRDNTFVKVNCAAIPTGLLESELFGHERGAFTGATTQKQGRFELAHQGTIFLDEVGEIPLELQVKLLRVLQEHEFERLGSIRTQRVDIRVVAATNRDLARMVAEKAFRSDLYYRLHVFPVTVPALRERPEDIPSLVRYFTKKYARQLNRPIGGVSEGVMNALCEYAWPGNIRELENVIERCVILSAGDTLELDRPLRETQSDIPPQPQASTLEDVERNHIQRALAECHWVISGPFGAAQKLGLKRTSLQYKMQKLGIIRAPSDPTV